MGGAVSSPPPQHHLIPPVRPPTQPDPEQSATTNSTTVQAAMSTMQTQLRETQSSLQAHADKICVLKHLVEKHKVMKRKHGDSRLAQRHGSKDKYDDDLDVRSVCTVTPEAEKEEQRAVGRPKTPELTGHRLMDDKHHQNVYPDHSTVALHNQNAMPAACLEALTTQLE
ncbi:hypothetical protein FRC08_016717 [Ceratobasidium sp. 394]|nr:hypothetical protein FRC08_016717 [Ceratobasidium sp. 394]